ncbi:ATP-dependent Clp protease ATP-binding subunit [Dialister succinatiphilus]|jgi:ATP-dependent Clp protease ATP-binding subunit ClpC|uniref:ATP-dependent Clp protease ATP-binding subunit n=1 Tax=Dialister succinatiphilus TaxID=487173 RepID=UPI002356153F|nr:ATP-dependent Clp protease ATP-binding subunit [Dialister succinatiphilus]MCI6029785.1 ATP-dependent Clp protease ATP-binding subunit [Dialister succinatiphilus]HJI29145.1 ATP-dependent Clp protease ATP-binding subunit [Veillonellaceae bacterium]
MEDRFTDGVKNAWKFAASEAAKLGSDYIGTEHLLLGIAHEKDSAGGKILNSLGVTVDAVEQLLSQYSQGRSLFSTGEVYAAPRTKRVLEMAVEEANELGNSYVGTEHLLLAILHEGGGLAVRILESFGVTQDKLQKAFEKVLSEDSGKSDKSVNLGDLDGFAVDLNEKAKQGKIDPVIGRTDEINRVIQILSRRNKNNPVLIGEPGVGKTAIAEGLAQRIVNNDVPEILKNCHIISLNMSSVVAGTKYRGEFEERLKKVIDEVKKHKDWILFVDELHTLVGAGSSEGSMDAANIMKPALARGELRCIGATTLKEYKKYIEKDAALERRFQPVKVGEPTPKDTLEILKGLRDRYEAFHKAKITDEALKAAVELSGRYITDRFQPDKAIDVIDEAAAKVRMEASSTPEGLKKKEEALESVNKEKEAAVSAQDFEKAAIYRDQAKKLQTEIDTLKKDWKGGDHDHLTVTEEDVAEVVSKWTGVPVQNLKKSDSERLLHLEDELHKRVIGQDEAVHAVATAIRRARAGMKDPKRPIGSFLFLGTTGVGKTELARALAECMFGSEKNMIRFDMSEYMEKHEVSRLVGAPPGYVGYEEGGQLTDAVRRNPYSVILFDEVEKAHMDFFNILLQVLDDGRLTDGQGRTVDFTNCVIIMTSNLGSNFLKGHMGKKLGFSSGEKEEKEESFEDIRKMIMDEVKRTFRPEFINRIDEIIVFHPLTPENLSEIVDLMLKKVAGKLERFHVSLDVSDEAKKVIIADGTDVEYGARPLKRTIQKEMEDPISELILQDGLKDKKVLHVGKDEKGKLTFKAE